MGFFSRLIKKVTEPVVSVVETVTKPIVNAVTSVVDTVVQTTTAVVDTVVEKVIEPVAEAVQQHLFEPFMDSVVEPFLESFTNTFEAMSGWLVSTSSSFVIGIADWAIGRAADTFLSSTLDYLEHHYTPVNPDFTRFQPVAPEEEWVQSSTTYLPDWSISEEIMVRDALVGSVIGMSDYSELYDAGAVTVDGYVTDMDKVYEGTIGWLGSMVDWAEARFDVIRIVEEVSDFIVPLYESNVSLSYHTALDEYFISIGGTDGLADVITDIGLVLEGSTGGSVAAISGIIDMFFEEDIAAGATVNLIGHSLGGVEAVQQYRNDPDRFEHVYAVSSAGFGGFDGTYYDQFVWDGIGDSNITEINGDDPGTDFNDLVTSLGHVGAGQTYFVDNLGNSAEIDDPILQTEFVDAHMPFNMWASLPGGDTPDLDLLLNA